MQIVIPLDFVWIESFLIFSKTTSGVILIVVNISHMLWDGGSSIFSTSSFVKKLFRVSAFPLRVVHSFFVLKY